MPVIRQAPSYQEDCSECKTSRSMTPRFCGDQDELRLVCDLCGHQEAMGFDVEESSSVDEIYQALAQEFNHVPQYEAVAWIEGRS